MNSFYVFTKENKPLFQLYNQIVLHYDEYKTGALYLLSGETGCGKTTALQMMSCNFKERNQNREIVWYTYEEMVSIILQCIRKEKPVAIEQSEITAIVIVENIEDLLGRDETKKACSTLMKQWVDAGIIVICTTNNSDVKLDVKHETIMVYPVLLDQERIQFYGKHIGIEISAELADSISQKIGGDFSKLRGVLKQQQLLGNTPKTMTEGA